MYNLIIIGGGPAGYTAALLSRKLGKTVLLIEKEELGGVCLNRGCIPTKSLLNSSKIYKKSLYSTELGIEIKEVTFNFSKAMDWKDKSINELRNNLSSLLNSKGITVINGEAMVLKNSEVKVNKEIYKTENILIATGSSPAIPSIPGINSKYVLTSREALQLKERPKSLTIIGGGVIGLEFASFFSSIGVKITLIEYEKSLLPTMESRISKILEKSMIFTIHLNSKVKSIDENITVFEKNGEEQTITADYILNATGRIPNSSQFNGLGIVNNSVVDVDDYMKTTIDNIYAAGDVTGKTFLAHGCVQMAETAVENMFGEPKTMDFSLIPSVVYSDPEVASIGITVKEAIFLDIPILKNNLYLKSNGKYLVENGFKDGLCMVLAHKDTRVLLGVHIIGTGVSEILTTAVMAIKDGYTIEQFKQVIFPHPTISEVIKDTMLFI